MWPDIPAKERVAKAALDAKKTEDLRRTRSSKGERETLPEAHGESRDLSMG